MASWDRDPGRPEASNVPSLHPLVRAAAGGALPEWARASPARRRHMERVADLMERWARTLGLDDLETTRWRAAGMLHDVLRDADAGSLRPMVAPELRDRPGSMLHGPAAAARLREAGVADDALLLAVSWHTMGHPGFDRLGRALYLADYLEPGREFDSERLATLRARVPHDLVSVLREVATRRIHRSLEKGRPLLEPTISFWNDLIDA